MYLINKPQVISYFSCFILTIFLLACGGSEDSTESESTTTTESTANTETVASSSSAPVRSDMITVNNESGEKLISFDLNPSETIIRYDKERKTLTGRSKRADKTKYYNEKGDIIAEVKLKEGSFKLKNTNGDLLWKVKIKPDKIKISDNEENENPYEIKPNENGKYKVKLMDEAIGEAKLKDGKVSVSGFQKMVIATPANSPAFAALSIKDIPEDLRLVIAAELMKN